jgi:hypothetical protein
VINPHVAGHKMNTVRWDVHAPRASEKFVW